MGAKALGIHSYCRLDFLMKPNGDMYCLEANTLPGMTPTSLLPQEAKAAGITDGSRPGSFATREEVATMIMAAR